MHSANPGCPEETLYCRSGSLHWSDNMLFCQGGRLRAVQPASSGFVLHVAGTRCRKPGTRPESSYDALAGRSSPSTEIASGCQRQSLPAIRYCCPLANDTDRERGSATVTLPPGALRRRNRNRGSKCQAILNSDLRLSRLLPIFTRPRHLPCALCCAQAHGARIVTTHVIDSMKSLPVQFSISTTLAQAKREMK